MPSVPSLFDEFTYGWDSAFLFPWLSYPPNDDHAGCNFFIQYKLAGELVSAGAKEWSHWGSNYFRFKIPHSTKDKLGKHVDDYHQWDRLKELANAGYPTYYATNSTLYKDTLRSMFKTGDLLDETPLLDVRTVNLRHKHVTFTDASSHFGLHSEFEEAPKIALSRALNTLLPEKTSTLKESIEELFRVLRDIGGNDPNWQEDLKQIADISADYIPSEFRAWRDHLLLKKFIATHLGALMLWRPDNR